MIIAFCGFKGSGKDTCANYLVENYNFIKLSFASKLKDILAILFGWNREKLEGQNTEDRLWREEIDLWWATKLNIPHFSPRFAMQFFGTELFRNQFHKEIWINVLEKEILLLLEKNPNQNIVISDARFPNEIELVKSMGGKIIHIYKEPLPLWFDYFKNKNQDQDQDQNEKFIKEISLLHP